VSFRWSVIISKLWRREVARVGKKVSTVVVFLEKRSLTRKFSKFCSERIHHLTDLRLVLCAIFVEFGRSEIGSHGLFSRQKNTISPRSLALSLSLLRVDRAQNLPGTAPDNVLRVLQIGSLSAEL